MWQILSLLALGPLLYLQGRHVRHNTALLPEPPGARSGIDGEGINLRLLILGDSAAAGVGVSEQQQALSGKLVSALAPSYRIDWELHAKTGASTASTLRYLQRLEPRSFDLVLTSLGVNDVTAGVRCNVWLGQQRELRRLLRHKFGLRQILISGVPPMDLFPALPQPLRWYLGRRADDLDRRLQRDLAAEPDCDFVSLRFSGDRGQMAADGFHPGPEIYAAWAARAADRVCSGI